MIYREGTRISVAGHTGLRFRIEGPAKTTTKALQSADTGCRDVDTMFMEVLRCRQSHQQRGHLEYLYKRSSTSRTAVHTIGKGKLSRLFRLQFGGSSY